MDDPDVVSLDDHFEGRQLQPLHSTNVFIYIYPTTLRPGTLQPDIDNRFSELLVTLERAGLHFVATLPAVGNVLPHLLSQLRIHLNAMRITFPHPDDETGIPWTPVKFYRTSEAALWLMRAVSRADLPDRYFTLDRLLRNGILHTQPPHPQHETLMLWIAPMFEPVTGPLVHFMDANAYRISGAHGSHGMADVHGCYAARVVWPFLQPRPGAEGEPDCGTNCPNGYLTRLSHVPTSRAIPVAGLEPRVQIQRYTLRATSPPPPRFDDAAYQLGIARLVACVTPSPCLNPPPSLEVWKRDVGEIARCTVQTLGNPHVRKLEIRASTVPKGAGLLLKYVRHLSEAEATDGGFDAGATGLYVLREQGQVALAGPENRRILFATMGLDVLIGGASGPGPAIAVLQEAIRNSMDDHHLWADYDSWKIPVYVTGRMPFIHAFKMQETGLLCALLLYHYATVPSALHPVFWVAIQSTVSDAIKMAKAELFTLEGMPTGHIRAWRIDDQSLDREALAVVLDGIAEVSDFLALPPARQEDIANEALRHLLLGIPPGHDDSDFTALVHFRKGFHAFFDIIPFPQRDNLAEITKYFWSGSLKKPCDILGRLDITLRSGDRIDTSWSQTSSILRKLGDADHEDVMFLIMLHDWIEAPGDVTNALRFLKGCAEHTSLAPDMRFQIEFADDLEDDVHLSLSVCAPRLTVSVGFDQWIWHAYSRTSQAAFAPEVLFNCAFADGPSIFNAP